ncbi:hypothetical protein SPACI_046020 [Sporomusa acidovorans DSM 3132]|uniref:Uncharacterized protein n=1 Tax=Sporomusa acidovorans (strain ATCC 49682 / DSM 3132 / Mol) TaxID=1123286 RepID=A0ABZ3J7W9_SPOA4|nr:hypothetical protein SPACI_37470 [Sporomusa acidovorans DSM 3132]SDF07619.1 hypothetical protein SAMN04488499_103216 [Sporomusa acidovorans]
MRISNLTTMLSLKAIAIVLAFMLFFSFYHQWIAFEERITAHTRVMENFTAHIEKTFLSAIYWKRMRIRVPIKNPGNNR